MDENKIEVDEQLKSDVQDMMEKLRTQAMLLGGRSMALVIANIIKDDMSKPGKRSMNDLRRTLKKVLDFCQKAIDSTVETPEFGADEDA